METFELKSISLQYYYVKVSLIRGQLLNDNYNDLNGKKDCFCLNSLLIKTIQIIIVVTYYNLKRIKIIVEIAG